MDSENRERYGQKAEIWKHKILRETIKENKNSVDSIENSARPYIIRVDKVKLFDEPNSITEVVNKKGGVDRNYYDETGRQKKQISNNDHGRPDKHPYGKHGEHAHDYLYSGNGELLGRPMRELTEQERKENGDIL